MQFEVDVSEFATYEQTLRRIGKTYWSEFVQNYVKTMAARTLSYVQPRTPVDTGLLRKSWHVGDVTLNGDTFEIEIYNDATSETSDGEDFYYGNAVEFGHFTVNKVSFVPGRFMLTISLDIAEREASKVFNLEFSKMIKELGL